LRKRKEKERRKGREGRPGRLLGSAEAAAAQRREEGEGAGRTSFGCGPKREWKGERGKETFFFLYFHKLASNSNKFEFKATPTNTTTKQRYLCSSMSATNMFLIFIVDFNLAKNII
jgi:hypothetical protein